MACQYVMCFTPVISGKIPFQSHMTIVVTTNSMAMGTRMNFALNRPF
ncbi:hypothetical protein C723_0710 [Christiangramia flava JLT2011]|uniref:Uncharacterized protein n=1 Tax=Christiangramia flava JLT2011 TaxID=1229726 RepID=A0A1L7I2T1_9FLAO|nr:hypothetical protein GRFL_1176 [Christiangramia flava JLT2011]OSS40402.1 hypothetical protein C723_0710 [Christiangramia flava JLT2011]